MTIRKEASSESDERAGAGETTSPVLLSAAPYGGEQVADGPAGALAEQPAERSLRFSVPHRKHVIPSRHAALTTGYAVKQTEAARSFASAGLEARPADQAEPGEQEQALFSADEPGHPVPDESGLSSVEKLALHADSWEDSAPVVSVADAEPVSYDGPTAVVADEPGRPALEQQAPREEPWENGALAVSVTKPEAGPISRAEPWENGALADVEQHDRDASQLQATLEIPDWEHAQRAEAAHQETWKLPASLSAAQAELLELPTTPLPSVRPAALPARQTYALTRRRALFLALLLFMVIVNATAAGFSQFFGAQGWGSAFAGSSSGGSSLLSQITSQLKLPSPTPGATVQATPAVPLQDQVVNALMARMTLDQKIGQMLMVRFDGITSYSATLDDMISTYHVGSVIEYSSNIASKAQLIALNKQIQAHGDLPMIIAIDQEGGTVDRLAELDGPEISASQIGATGDPQKAYAQGVKDGQTLASYGINLNLAPVVDVTNVYNSQLVGRTYGNNPTIVTQMAGAYLNGLQSGGQVLGTIKHFPGLGDTSTDPHTGLPYLGRSLDQLNAIDWAPYKSLIAQGDVYSIMVTHEIVKALDTTLPSSLSPKVVGILRNQLHFNGVIITDGLNMDAILDRYSIGQAAVLAIQAGDDLIMDPDSPYQLAQMVASIKQALNAGTITQAQIDQSVRRILLFKYQMGLLHINS